MRMSKIACLLSILGALGALAVPAEETVVSIEESEGRVRVSIGKLPFTELRSGQGRSKPVLYPIFGPGQVPMTRDFPFKTNTKGEKHDHPHHESLWYTHGDVNGISFWHLGEKSGHIRQTDLQINGDEITTTNDWLDPKMNRVCSDRRTVRFSTLPGGARMIDYSITIEASDGKVKFGDTKEGSMGLRTHHLLRTDRGAEVSNSAGERGKSIWGKAAKWVNYQSKIDGKPVGVAIFDNPRNPRHPTTWHARDYGLVAANPFGAHDFSKAKKGSGDLVIQAGESVTFRYAFLFHHGTDEKRTIDEHYLDWAE